MASTPLSHYIAQLNFDLLDLEARTRGKEADALDAQRARIIAAAMVEETGWTQEQALDATSILSNPRVAFVATMEILKPQALNDWAQEQNHNTAFALGYTLVKRALITGIEGLQKRLQDTNQNTPQLLAPMLLGAIKATPIDSPLGIALARSLALSQKLDKALGRGITVDGNPFFRACHRNCPLLG